YLEIAVSGIDIHFPEPEEQKPHQRGGQIVGNKIFYGLPGLVQSSGLVDKNKLDIVDIQEFVLGVMVVLVAAEKQFDGSARSQVGGFAPEIDVNFLPFTPRR